MARETPKNGPDFFETPEWVTHILCDFEKFEGKIWECACGAGKMAKVLKERTGLPVLCTDLFDYGFGTPGIDFLKTSGNWDDMNIITNPPYNILNKFILHGLELKPKKFALLCRTLTLETGGRYEIFQKYPLKRVIVISDRVDFQHPERPGGYWSLSWFVWEKNYKGRTVLEWARFKK